MNVDIYTKCILSVIAVALLMIAVQNSANVASAKSEFQKVLICSPGGYPIDCAKIHNGRLSVNTKSKVSIQTGKSGVNILRR